MRKWIFETLRYQMMRIPPELFMDFGYHQKILYKTYKLILIATHDQHLISQLPGKITRLNSK